MKRRTRFRKLGALTGGCCPHCGSTRIVRAWTSWAKGFAVVFLFPVGILALFLPSVRKCRDCKLRFRIL
ncbi:MAG: hypothetical protein HKN82_16990 [Akkermansiaceae bacterium]|nr:hypothetical protein [Akkermansiaceae bacterium]